MSNSNTVLAQILHFIPEYELARLVKLYNTDHYAKTFKTKHLLISLLFAQSIEAELLRDITDSFKSLESYLYHLGLPSTGVKRSTLADANNRIDHQVFRDLFYLMLHKFQSSIFKRDLGLKADVYALDATFIDTVMSMMDWSRFRVTKGAIKLHTMYSVTQQLPVLVNITAGEVHDLEGMPFLGERFSSSIVTFDKGYWRAHWLHSLTQRQIGFVTRIKSNVNYQVIGQHPCQVPNNLDKV